MVLLVGAAASAFWSCLLELPLVLAGAGGHGGCRSVLVLSVRAAAAMCWFNGWGPKSVVNLRLSAAAGVKGFTKAGSAWGWLAKRGGRAGGKEVMASSGYIFASLRCLQRRFAALRCGYRKWRGF